MSSEREDSLQTGGFWIFGFLSVVLAILKLTVATYWSWLRVLLPSLAFFGHNALYVLVGLLCFRWLKNEAYRRSPIWNILGALGTINAVASGIHFTIE